MRYTEPEIWKLTPRQLQAQLSVHEDVTKKMYGRPDSDAAVNEPTGFIDQIKGW